MSIALLSTILTHILVFILPFIYSPLSRDAIEFPKHFLIAIFTAIYLLIFAYKIFRHQTIEYYIRITDLPILAFVVISIISWIRVPNMLEVLSTPGSIATLICLSIIYFLIPSIVQGQLKFSSLITNLQTSTIALSIFVVLLRLNVFSGSPFERFFPNGLITPAGSITTTLAYIFAILITSMIYTIINIKKITITQKIFNISFISIFSLVLIFSLFSILTSEIKPVLPDIRVSWHVAMESYKDPTYAIVGSGPGNYRNLYSAARPNFANLLPSWNILFSSASNWYLTVFTETGLAGFLIILWLIVSVALTRKINAGTYALLIALLIHPPTILLLAILFIVMTIELPTLTVLRIPLSFNDKKHSPLAIFGSIVTIAISILIIYPTIQITRAEYHINQAVNYAQNTSAGETVNHINKALEINPYASDYRVIASRAAIAVARRITQTEEPLTEDQQRLLSEAIDNAITKGQQAILLRSSASNWENLSAIYQVLIGSAEKADQWTFVSLREAIRRHPSNPNYYITAGQIFIRLNNYPSAITTFTKAVELKPDHLNALFNLANAYNLNNEPARAESVLKQALNIAKPDSQEANQIKEEIEKLAQSAPQEPATPPTPPQIILNDDQAPPVEDTPANETQESTSNTSPSPTIFLPQLQPTPTITPIMNDNSQTEATQSTTTGPAEQ